MLSITTIFALLPVQADLKKAHFSFHSLSFQIVILPTMCLSAIYDVTLKKYTATNPIIQSILIFLKINFPLNAIFLLVHPFRFGVKLIRLEVAFDSSLVKFLWLYQIV